jgi:hypothetical protein
MPTPYQSMRLDEQARTEALSSDVSLPFPITPEARSYAVKQLARRAAVSSDFFRSWDIHHSFDHTVIHLGHGSRKILYIKHATPGMSRPIALGRFPVGRAQYRANSENGSNWELPIPFVSTRQQGPLFAIRGPDQIDCSLDILASILFSLSRFEETLPVERDSHERFLSASSVAVQNDFSDRPVVDEYGLALELALKAVLPGWKPSLRNFCVKLSHDIDRVGIPFSIKTAIGHLVKRRCFAATLRDTIAPVSNVRPAYLEAVLSIANLSRQYGLHSAVYWKASKPGPWDDGYDPRDRTIIQVIEELAKRGVENGVHPGYETYLHPHRLAEEIAILKDLLPRQFLGGRQHYLRWSPQTWVDWENCGLAYDSTVGFSDRIGFRAGTCFPYRPWIMSLNREARLLEVPLIVMDRVLLSIDRPVNAVLKLVNQCQRVGGVFTLLWHNESLLHPTLRRLYRQLLHSLAGCRNFDCSQSVADPYA